jgi:Flp pilus assembly protein TadG
VIRLLRALSGDRKGATMVEFALVAPVLLMTLMGIFDLAYNTYTTIMLEGAIQKAARDSTIEGADARSKEIDEAVTRAVRHIAPHSELVFARKAYTNFSDVAEPEDFTDVDKNGSCNDGEPFEDVNGNGTWDADRGVEGMGSARDAVLYTVTVEVPRLFPVAKAIGLSETFTTQAETVLRNQPFSQQEERATLVQNCS